MKNKWTTVIVLACAQFVMVLDSTVMNVSISAVVKDLHTTVTAMQTCITFYTLTMAALMLIGAKLGDIWGRRRAFIIGAVVYACGSLITALSPNIGTLFLGWSIVEGLGAVLVIPAIAALIANNYKGRERITAFAIIGGVSGAAMAAGPLIGGFMTTYLSWRYVFFGEVLIMAVILLFNGVITDTVKAVKSKIDLPSAIYSAVGLIAVVYGMLQSKVWGWLTPKGAPIINGHAIAPLGVSLVAYLLLLGVVMIKLFFGRQQKLQRLGKQPLVDPALFAIKPLLSGLSVVLSQYAIIAGVFFVIPVYLQMMLGYDALKTGLKIFPLSLSLIVFSVIGTRLAGRYSPKLIIRLGQYILIGSSLFLLSSISVTLKGWLFATAMVCLGAGLGLIASQTGNVNMSSVDKKQSSEVGGLQGVFQNLGSSLGTALIGSVLIASLSSVFNTNIQASNLPASTKSYVSTNSKAGVTIMPLTEVSAYAESKGLPASQSSQVTQIYSDSQVSALRTSLYALIALSILSLFFSTNIPKRVAR
jgi:MFS family permease